MSLEPVASAGAEPIASSTGNTRALIGVLASVAGSGMAWGTLMPLIPVLLERRGTPTALIGLVSSAPTLSVLIIAPLMPWLLRRFGVMPCVFSSLTGVVVCLLLMPVLVSSESWFVLRLLIGLGGGFHWVLSEAWINTVVRPGRRGLYLGIYATLFMIGFALGPLLLAQMDLDGVMPFAIVAGAIALAGVALFMVLHDLPPISRERQRGQWHSLAVAPVLFAVILAAGTVDSGALSLLPIYAIQKGSSEAHALLLASIFNIGSVISQIPIGLLADRMHKRTLLFALCLVFAAGAALLPVLHINGWMLWPLLFVWGSAGAGIYTLALIGIGEVFPGAALASANALFVMIYSLGHLIGPPIAGASMDGFGPDGLAYSSLAAMLLFLLAAPFLHDKRPGWNG